MCTVVVGLWGMDWPAVDVLIDQTLPGRGLVPRDRLFVVVVGSVRLLATPCVMVTVDSFIGTLVCCGLVWCYARV